MQSEAKFSLNSSGACALVAAKQVPPAPIPGIAKAAAAATAGDRPGVNSITLPMDTSKRQMSPEKAAVVNNDANTKRSKGGRVLIDDGNKTLSGAAMEVIAPIADASPSQATAVTFVPPRLRAHFAEEEFKGVVSDAQSLKAGFLTG